MANIGSASCVSDDEVYEETRKVLEGCDLDDGVQQFILICKPRCTKMVLTLGQLNYRL